MGGGKAVFEANEQYRKSSKELDEVKFYVHFADEGNLIQFDLDRLYKSLCTKVSSYFDQNCIKYSDASPVESGGGGIETLWVIVKIFWENRDLIALFVSLWGIVKSVYKFHLNSNVQNLKPQIDIHLWIEIDTAIDKPDRRVLQYLLSRRLANLLVISNGLMEALSDEYKPICFNFSVEVKINKQQYSVALVVPHEMRRNENITRLLKVARDLNFKKGTFYRYFLTRWHLICRSDVKFSEKWDRESDKNYYLLISTKILSDYF